jgi:hypothetical protein
LEFWLLTIALPTSILFCKGAKLFSYSLLESTPRLWTIISANPFHDSFSPSSRIDGLLRNEIGKKMRMIHELIFGGRHLYIKTGLSEHHWTYTSTSSLSLLWKSRCQGKHKVFLWLLLNDRLNTRNLLRRKRFNIPSVNCVLCSHGMEETIKHFIFECEFAQMCL